MAVHESREYNALKAMQFGAQADGTPPQDPTPRKLDKADLLTYLTKAELKGLPKGPRIYVVKGGLSVQQVADEMGYSERGGAAGLLKAMLGLPPMQQAIDGGTAARMQELHPSMQVDGRLQDAAEAAVSGEHRQKIIRSELRALTKAITGQVIPSAATLKEMARRFGSHSSVTQARAPGGDRAGARPRRSRVVLNWTKELERVVPTN